MKIYLAFMVILFSYFLILSAQEGNENKNDIAVKNTALDYAEGYYDGDGDRMKKAIHPDLNKVYAVTLPQTGKTFLQYSTVSQLVEMSNAKAGYLEPDKRKITVTVLLNKNDIACVKLTSAIFNDYLQMVRFDGEWKIVNVLWSLGADAPNRPAQPEFDPENEKNQVESTVEEYYQGIYTGDVEKLEKAVHPEISAGQLNKVPKTGRYMISRNCRGSLLEITRAKLRSVPEDKRQIGMNTLDIMDRMGFVEAITQNSTSYFQLQQIDGRWNIVNVLAIPNEGQR